MIDAEFLHNPPDKGLYCHCPSIIETQSGTLMVAWYTYPEEEYIGATLTISKKHKHHSTWSLSESILPSSKYSLGNPMLFQDPGGRIHLLYVAIKGKYWNDAYLQEAWSDDEGQTWSNPTQLLNSPGMMVRHPPVLLDSGSYLLPSYDEAARQTVLLSSQPPFSKWREVYRFKEPGLIQSALVNNNGLSLVFRPTTDPRKISISHSSDQGKTWTQPESTTLPNPLSGISAFSAGNNLVVIYNHTEEHQRWPLSSSLIRNGSKTWGKVQHIDSVNMEVSYPSFISGKMNLVHGVYSYNRRMIKYVKLSMDSFL